MYKKRFKKKKNGLTDISPSSSGVEFVKKMTDTLEQKMQDSLQVGDTLYRDVQVGDETVKRKTAVTFKWEGDDQLLDNANVFTPGVGWKYFGITVKLALNMGWLTYHPTSYSHHRGPLRKKIFTSPSSKQSVRIPTKTTAPV